MSQITRCPSCSTSFKVVADQLRISEGWVRCGQCKEVFDASAHLLPSAPPSLLPDVSLTDIRPPPAPVARATDAGRAWGAPPPVQTLVTPPAGASVLGAALRSAQPTAPRHSDAVLYPSASTTAPSPAPAPLPVMDVPTPAVPAFLTAGALGASGAELSLEPVTPFAWRPSPPPPSVSDVDTLARDVAQSYRAAPASSTPAPPTPIPAASASVSAAHDVPPPGFADTVPASLDALELPASAGSIARGGPGYEVPQPVPGGYELPFAELRDSEWPADLVHATDPAGVSVPEADDASFPSLGASVAPAIGAPGAPSASDGSAQWVAEAEPQSGTSSPAADQAGVDLPPVDFVPAQATPDAESLAVVEDDSAAAVLRADTRKTSTAPDADEDRDPEHDEVSFVRAARRKAFWRQPGVRLVLAVFALTALVALALQVAVQERDRIVAMDARARPWLAKLCAPLQCEIAPQRQIADVVIDSSSFNKARGDSYQLALTMKSQATIPLAMPAVELTLTDAQDQPVLRRVLLPTDMAAPAELPARGEWSASVAVIVTTGGARVAGYRLLAFYP